MKSYCYALMLFIWCYSAQASGLDKSVELQSILSSVSEEIEFEPYRGNLRSIDFVEKSKKANSLDTSLLLLHKLKSAGFRAHIVQGQLLDKNRQALINTFAKVSGARLYSSTDSSIETALAQHFWVEVLLDNRLVPMDASFVGAQLGKNYGDKKGVVTALTPYQHKFKIVHKLKNKAGQQVVLGTYSSTTSLQGAEPISFVTVAEPILAVVGRKTGFFGGGLSGIAGGVAGDKGNSTSKDATVVGKTYKTNLITKKGSRTLGQYKATFNIANAAIEEEWLEITQTFPGETPTTVKRPLFSASADGDPVDYRLLTINILPGAIPLELAKKEIGKAEKLKSITQTPPAVESFQQATSTNSQIGPLAGLMLNLSIAGLSDRQTYEVAQRNRVFPVFDKPRIYITTLEGSHPEGSEKISYHLSFDYRVDDISTFYLQQDAQALSYYFSLARGLQQSTLEGLMLDKLQSDTGYSTTEIMLKASEQGISRQVLTPINADRINSFSELSETAKRHITNALHEGDHIIIPEKPVLFGKERLLGWWRLDPETGKTTGVLESGLHGAFLEYGFVNSKVTVNDQRGFVLGMLVGANATSMMLMSQILSGNPLNDASIAQIKDKLKRLACASCYNPGYKPHVSLSMDAKIGCFKLFKMIAAKGYVRLGSPFSFCGAYSAGFNCAVNMVLDRINNKPNIDLNDPYSYKPDLSCPGS